MPIHSYTNNLHNNNNLRIDRLVGVFSNTSASYKFYWFLGILDILAEGKQEQKEIPFHEVVIRMMALSWYTINFHKLSFGVQDKLARSIKTIIFDSNGEIAETASKREIIDYLEKNYKRYKKEIDFFNDKVPYHFLTPFIGSHGGVKKNYVAEASIQYSSESPCPYQIVKKNIEIHPLWRDYLIQHYVILKDFTLWNFTYRFLQAKNPNTPNITSKLIERPVRKSLSVQTKLWKLYAEQKSLFSIYTNTRIEQFDLDHYVPWSFVAHDHLWNLAPIEKSLNSSKSNKLPNHRLLEHFTNQQYDFFQTIYQTYSKKKLEDYSIIFNLQTSEINNLPKGRFTIVLEDHIKPLIQFASNQGFENWEF